MNCPSCGFGCSSVVDSRPIDGRQKRRRECEKCGYRYTTIEVCVDEYVDFEKSKENVKKYLVRIIKKLEELNC